jgi:hypothetical protein
MILDSFLIQMKASRIKQSHSTALLRAFFCLLIWLTKPLAPAWCDDAAPRKGAPPIINFIVGGAAGAMSYSEYKKGSKLQAEADELTYQSFLKTSKISDAALTPFQRELAAIQTPETRNYVNDLSNLFNERGDLVRKLDIARQGAVIFEKGVDRGKLLIHPKLDFKAAIREMQNSKGESQYRTLYPPQGFDTSGLGALPKNVVLAPRDLSEIEAAVANLDMKIAQRKAAHPQEALDRVTARLQQAELLLKQPKRLPLDLSEAEAAAVRESYAQIEQITEKAAAQLKVLERAALGHFIPSTFLGAAAVGLPLWAIFDHWGEKPSQILSAPLKAPETRGAGTGPLD